MGGSSFGDEDVGPRGVKNVTSPGIATLDPICLRRYFGNCVFRHTSVEKEEVREPQQGHESEDLEVGGGVDSGFEAASGLDSGEDNGLSEVMDESGNESVSNVTNVQTGNLPSSNDNQESGFSQSISGERQFEN